MKRSRIFIPLLFFQAEVIHYNNHQKELVRDQPVASELGPEKTPQSILV